MARMCTMLQIMFLLILVPPSVGMEPLAILSKQAVWQAGEPIAVNVDYDGIPLAQIHLI